MYSDEGIEHLLREHPRVDMGLERLEVVTLQNSDSLTNDRARTFLRNGVGRRLRLLRRCLANVFELFPPAAIKPIDQDDLDDTVINLHAFVINTYGLFDNLAWAFVSRHGLEEAIKPHTRVGFFLADTKKYMPETLQSYIGSPKMVEWHLRYLKNYRDALAHKIPLYIPPAVYSEEEAEQFRSLQTLQNEYALAGDWTRVQALLDEQHQLGSAQPIFLHSFSDLETNRPVHLHPQMMADALTVVEACDMFFAHWGERN